MALIDLLIAVFTAGLPLFLLSFLMVSWALYRGRLAGQTVKEIQGSIDALGKARKDKTNNQDMDPALAKWFRFGGGFYGLMALYTWLLIEWDDAASFIFQLGDIVINLDPGLLIGALVEFFVESVMNFVLAIAWPAYWLTETGDVWLKLIVAYGGYWLGIRAAQHAWHEGWVKNAMNRIFARARRRS